MRMYLLTFFQNAQIHSCVFLLLERYSMNIQRGYKAQNKKLIKIIYITVFKMINSKGCILMNFLYYSS